MRKIPKPLSLNFFLILFIATYLNGCAYKNSKVNEGSTGKYPVYGNWCGPQHPKYLDLIDPPEPIDSIDSACMEHDICYQEQGYFSCECDQILLKRLQRTRLDIEDERQREIITAMISYFYFSPGCKGNITKKGIYKKLFDLKTRSGIFPVDLAKYGIAVTLYTTKCITYIPLMIIGVEGMHQRLQNECR